MMMMVAKTLIKKTVCEGFVFATQLTYSMSTNFCLKLIEPSAREVFDFGTLAEKEEKEASEER